MNALIKTGLGYLVNNWKGAMIASLTVGLIALGAGYRASLIAKGRAEERLRTADSTSHVLDSTLNAERGLRARVDTVWAHDTLRFVRQVAKLVHDTGWVHDTIRVAGELRVEVPMAVVDSTRLALKTCSSLIGDCEARTAVRDALNATLTKDVSLWKFQAQHPPPHSCLGVGGVSGVVGGILGALIEARIKR